VGIRDRNVTGVQTCALPIFVDVRGRAASARASFFDVEGFDVQPVRRTVTGSFPVNVFGRCLLGVLDVGDDFLRPQAGLDADVERSEERRGRNESAAESCVAT